MIKMQSIWMWCWTFASIRVIHTDTHAHNSVARASTYLSTSQTCLPMQPTSSSFSLFLFLLLLSAFVCRSYFPHNKLNCVSLCLCFPFSLLGVFKSSAILIVVLWLRIHDRWSHAPIRNCTSCQFDGNFTLFFSSTSMMVNRERDRDTPLVRTDVRPAKIIIIYHKQQSLGLSLYHQINAYYYTHADVWAWRTWARHRSTFKWNGNGRKKTDCWII